MHLVGELTLDYRTYRQLALAPSGARLWCIRSVGVLLVICSLAPLFESDGGIVVVIPGLILGFLLVFLLDLAVLIGWQRTRGLSSQPFRYELTDDGVSVHTAQTSVTVRWEGISRIRAVRRAWLFAIAATLAVPRAAFPPAVPQYQIDQYVGGRPASFSARA
jgi:hypothetical protein